MSDLDKKLREILKHIVMDDRSVDGLLDGVAQIKQVFANAGWHHSDNSKVFSSIQFKDGLRLDGRLMMTGSEWLERFEKELESDSFPPVDDKEVAKMSAKDKVTLIVSEIKLAARRASGVDDD